MMVVHVHLSRLFVRSVYAPMAMRTTHYSAVVLFVLVPRRVVVMGVVRVVVLTS